LEATSYLTKSRYNPRSARISTNMGIALQMITSEVCTVSLPRNPFITPTRHVLPIAYPAPACEASTAC